MTDRPSWATSYVEARRLSGDQWLVVGRLTFGRGRVSVCTEYDACIEAY